MDINMSYQISDSEKKSIMAELKATYIYIITPFILLVFVKLYSSNYQDILTASDWSLAACIIFGQITANISKSVSSIKLSTNESQFSYYTAKRFLCVVVSLMLYFAVLLKPHMYLGIAQIIIFIFASYMHFRDGFTNFLLQRKIGKK